MKRDRDRNPPAARNITIRDKEKGNERKKQRKTGELERVKDEKSQIGTEKRNSKETRRGMQEETRSNNDQEKYE